MIMVVMVGMSILFGALIVYSDNFHKGSGSSVLESITMEDLQFKTSTNSVVLSLFNTGKTDLTVTNIYINGEMAILQLTPPDATVSIGMEKHYDSLSVAAPPGMTFTSGVAYSFKIVTSRGTGFEGTYIC